VPYQRRLIDDGSQALTSTTEEHSHEKQYIKKYDSLADNNGSRWFTRNLCY
jgi:hypothetical protein